MAIHFKLLTVLALCTISAVSGQGQLLWSIDCGAPTADVSTDFLVPWIGDSDFFQTGTSVQRVLPANSKTKVMDTLRVFTARKKNCYDLKVGANTKVLVRATFNYGNYDLKSTPPTFDLHFDGNYWITVNLINDYIYHEVVYVAKRDYISVCLAQTRPNQFPFINALEVRSLDPLMYSKLDDANVGLVLRNRVAYGATSAIRYSSDDPYDRIWSPARVGDGMVKVSNEALLVLDTFTLDHPPQSMLQDAMTTLNTSTPLILDTRFPLGGSEIYLNLYISEVTKLTSLKRSFQVFINNQVLSKPILPSFQYVTELYLSNYNASSGVIFSLVATTDSDLPPVISGLESFTISDVLTEGTNIHDFLGLVSVQKAFGVLNDWGGDPCLPSPYSWEWVNCSADAIPRITAINLSGYGLEGTIPDLSSMTALETINFQNNNLVGPIPDSLGSLPNLTLLNVANNKLSGPVPTSLSKNGKLELVWSGNPLLCLSGCQGTPPSSAGTPPSSAGGNTNTPAYVAPHKSSKKSKTPIILGITIPAFVLLWAIVGLVLVLRKRKAPAVTATTAGGANWPRMTPEGGNWNEMNPEMVSGNRGVAMNELPANVNRPAEGQTSNQPRQEVDLYKVDAHI